MRLASFWYQSTREVSMKDFPCQAISIYKWERCNLTLKGSPIINVGVRRWTYGLARSKYVRPSKYVR